MDSSMQGYFLTLFSQELAAVKNPHLTYETIVIRFLKRMAQEHFHVPWSTVQDTIRHGVCFVSLEQQNQLYQLWRERKRPLTFDEQHCVERILGKDYLRPGDVLKLASCFHKLEDGPLKWEWFAVDGYLGDDLKKYTDAFRFYPEDAKYYHAMAVRRLYREMSIQSPDEMRNVLEVIFRASREQLEPLVDETPLKIYLDCVGGWSRVKEMAEWRWDSMEKNKKKDVKRSYEE